MVHGARLLTINACCLASGLQNANLPELMIFSSLGLLAFELWLAFSFLPAWLAWLGVPAAYLLSVAGGSSVARMVGGLLSLATGSHDFKHERLSALADCFADYDVVAVQECFGCTAFSGNPDHLIELAAARGLRFAVRPPRVERPSCCMDSGLLILSRWPIRRHEHLVFRRQFFFEALGANRGACFALVEAPPADPAAPGAPPLAPRLQHIFTCHIMPSYTGLMPLLPAWMQRRADGVRADQCVELAGFVRRHWDHTLGGCVALGDFNAHLRIDASGALQSQEHPTAQGLRLATRSMEAAGLVDASDGAWQPTCGYPDEVLLTSTKQRASLRQTPLLEDLVFVDVQCAARLRTRGERSRSVSMARRGAQHAEARAGRAAKRSWTHMSDHWGVELRL